MEYNFLDEMDKAITDDLLDEGNYLCTLKKLSYKKSSTNKDMITAIIEVIEDEEGEQHNKTFFEHFVFEKNDGTFNEYAMQRYYNMLSAFSEYVKKEEIYERFLSKTIEDTADKSAKLEGSKCVIFAKQEEAYNQSGEEEMDNKIAVFKMIPEEWDSVPF